MTVDSQSARFVEIVALLRQLTAQLIASPDLDDALARLVATAADLVEGPAWCGVTIIRGDGPATAAASGELPTALDGVQYGVGDGPCLHALRTREMVLVNDLDGETRWPAWRKAATARGIAGVLSVPVDIDDHVIGSLNLYSGEPGRFSPDVELTVMLVAEHAGLLLAAVLDRGRLAGLTEDLRAALGAGEVVNRAVGIVMAQRGCSAEAALDVLREAAVRLHQPLSVVAERLVTTISARGAV